jgi:uncharacterized protein YjiK
MKKFIPGIIMICLLLGCKRNEPTETSTNTSDIPSLSLIAEYSTSVPEPSGLTYYSKDNSLLTVSDANSTVYELDFYGNVLKEMSIASSDLEGIALSANCDTFYVVEETNRLVSKYLMNGKKLSSFSVDVATVASHSLEGITVDNNNHLFVLNEKSPGMLLEFIGSIEVFRKEISYTIDCSDIFYDKDLDCLWMVSDESRSVLKLSKTGDLLAQYSIPFLKGEGITIVQDKIYIVSDSDGKLYVFQKP